MVKSDWWLIGTWRRLTDNGNTTSFLAKPYIEQANQNHLILYSYVLYNNKQGIVDEWKSSERRWGTAKKDFLVR